MIYDINIKIATKSDYEKLQNIVDCAFKDTNQEGLGNLANGILLNSGTYFYASKNNIPLACGGFTKEDPFTKEIKDEIAHIRNFATHPNARRLGLAKALMDFCEKEAKLLGIQTLNCYSSLEGELFYKSCGFIEIKREIVKIAQREVPIIYMAKNII